ncbi:Peptidoglycan/xylan/chitin deacetylase, PgdA/CDA1 family [Xaviernesmea oryzae]|uniref:Chitooligosaccharide deacetylase n=1 Tax=Xaviernesmea oryzae TaxID=464029 RepID=A0A1X7F5E0_9HYPH|nr:Peptidoglycan/xylan/chitin deacetylase, PgdA/CDA1 family [Xaviernesmea oryzae]
MGVIAVGNTKERLQALWRRDVKRRLVAGGLDMAAALARAGMMANARGRGAIFTLHHVRPKKSRPLQPSAHLEVTPDFLSEAIERLSAEGYEFVPLAEVPARLAKPSKRPFAAFTLDDGYRNNAAYALPVFERHNAPFTIFVTRGFAERTHSLWWETLAELLGQAPEVTFDFGDGPELMDLTSEARKFDAFDRISHYVGTTDEASAVSRIDAMAKKHGVDPLKITADLTMDAQELRALSAHPLASLGAHTISHRAVARLSPEEAREEMRQSADYVEMLTGERPRSLAYPYGTQQAVSERDMTIAKELGFSVAVTTQPGTLCEKHASRLTGLPRISLNGYYQQPRYVSALASGIPFSIGR